MMRRAGHRSLACLAFCMAQWAVEPACAGDEVDYSAPYVTVENGELVTKYPDKQHQADESSDVAAGVSAIGQSLPWWGLLAFGAVIAGFAITMKRRR